MLEDPQTHILDPGGQIWFARVPQLGAVGTCALKKSGQAEFELSKMGVSSRARGQKVGEKLLERVIFAAYRAGADRSYLLTNHRCEAAIHLYQKHGFEHCAKTLAEHGATYSRSNVAMVHRRRGRFG